MTGCHKEGVRNMPTTTFFRLDQEKQDKIIQAAKKEFTEVPIHEASIAKIIKEADIPRGSFYQYFSGKEDLFYYLFDRVRKGPEDYLFECLESEKGDLLEAFKKFFDYFVKEVFEGEETLFFKNIFLHMTYHNSSRALLNELSEKEQEARKNHIENHRKGSKEAFERIYQMVNHELLKTTSEREFKMLFRQLCTMISNTINEGYRIKKCDKKFSVEQLIQDFNLKIDWLRNGVAN